MKKTLVIILMLVALNIYANNFNHRCSKIIGNACGGEWSEYLTTDGKKICGCPNICGNKIGQSCDQGNGTWRDIKDTKGKKACLCE